MHPTLNALLSFFSLASVVAQMPFKGKKQQDSLDWEELKFNQLYVFERFIEISLASCIVHQLNMW